MDFDLWWLLAIPLVFGLGWVAARLDARQLRTEQSSLPRSYFKGLNFLLNEQPTMTQVIASALILFGVANVVLSPAPVSAEEAMQEAEAH